MKRLCPLAVLIAALLTHAAGAHTRDRVFSSWTVDGEEVTAAVRLPARLASRYVAVGERGGGEAAALARHFVRTLHISRGSAECTLAKAPLARHGPESVSFEFFWQCPAPNPAAGNGRLFLRVDSLFRELPNHVHFARLRLPDGGMDEAVFTYGDRVHRIGEDRYDGAAKRTWTGLTVDYAGLGVTHILAGADHLAFLLALMLAASGLRAILLVVTGFTLGHSLTLALAATGAASPVAGVIEALIGFTVAVAAVDAMGRLSAQTLSPGAAILPLAALALAAAIFGSAIPAVTWGGLLLFTAAYMALARRTENGQWAIALAGAFGLVHGFGFAGALQEIGLPEDRLVPALLGFNLGVEAGQLAVIALGLSLAAAIGRFMPAGMRLPAARGAAAALCGLGTFWFVSRAFAG